MWVYDFRIAPRRWRYAAKATRRAVATDRFRGGSVPVCLMDRLRLSVPSRPDPRSQAPESPVPRPRQHETKRCAATYFGLARRRPTTAHAACGAAGLMLHLAAGGVQHDHIQHQRSSPRSRGEPDHPATRHKIRALIDDHRCSRGALH